MKTRKTRTLVILTLLFVLVFAIASPALAQDVIPPPADDDIVDIEAVVAFLKNIGIFLLIGVGVIFGVERGTELGKIIARVAAKNKFTKFLYVQGTGSVALSVLVAFVTVYQFDVNLLERFTLLKDSLDPELLRIITGMLVWVGSTYTHKELPEVLHFARKIKPYKTQSGG